MQINHLRLKFFMAVLAGMVLVAAPPVQAAEENDAKPPPQKAMDEDTETATPEAEAKPSPDCENVQIAVNNASGQAVKLISVDYSSDRRWTRGRIIFRTIDDGASHTWTASLKDLAGKEVRFRVNTRFIVDAMTDRYSDLNSALIPASECVSEAKHAVTLDKP